MPAKHIDASLAQELVASPRWVATPGPGCFIWAGKVDRDGYGVLRSGKRDLRAHRVAYVAAFGNPDLTLELDHTCHTPACVNPDHLEPVTRQENLARRRDRNGDLCQRGHPLEHVSWRKGRSCRTCKRMRERVS